MSYSILRGPRGNKVSNRLRRTGTRMVFDDDAYFADINNGMSFEQRVKKMKRGDYWVSAYSKGME